MVLLSGWASLRSGNAEVMLCSGVLDRTRPVVVLFPCALQLAIGSLRGILKQAGVTSEDFNDKL